MTRTGTAGLAVAVLAALNACQPPTDESVAASEAVRSADIAWAQAFSRKDLAGYLAFVDSAAAIQQPNGPTVTGREAIRTLIEGFYALPNLRGTWHPAQVEAARSGDLAYSTGAYELTFDDPSGKPVTERGRYLEVWRRHADGRWRMVVESFNSDLPLPGAAPH